MSPFQCCHSETEYLEDTFLNMCQTYRTGAVCTTVSLQRSCPDWAVASHINSFAVPIGHTFRCDILYQNKNVLRVYGS